jgi:hypothetical protein
MNIRVKATPSEVDRTFSFSLEELGYSDEEWNSLSSGEKIAAIQKELENLPEQPYWAFNGFA